ADRAASRQAVKRWMKDADLAGLRDPARAELPAEDREASARLWADAADVADGQIGPFLKRVAALPAAEQIEEVRKELRGRNPKSGGQLTPAIEGGAVTGLEVTTDGVTDVAPVRALTRLRRLALTGSDGRKGALADLTPLAGMPLEDLDLSGNPGLNDLSPLKGMRLRALKVNSAGVMDLTPLAGMPLERLHLWGGFWGSDLTPLKGMPLKWLNCGGGGQKLDLAPLAGLPLDFLCFNHTQVSDLTPLKAVPLTGLHGSNTLVTDLNPLRGMRLRHLHVVNCKVSDLAPLAGMPLTALEIRGAAVTDLSPLAGLPLKSISCDGPLARDAPALRAIRTLETVNGKPPADSWLSRVGKRFPAVLRGEDRPADGAERLAFARLAHGQKHFALAARLVAEALAADPRLGDDRDAAHRHVAARYAALAASGQGKDAGKLDDTVKAKLRGQARDWLTAERAALAKLLESGGPAARPAVVAALTGWQNDGDLAGIRDKPALDGLPADERAAFTRMWADVAGLLEKARERAAR
ncbi:MAG: leucine-rich repeat domain-containing protein, partial [Gemmataceae bacterium]